MSEYFLIVIICYFVLAIDIFNLLSTEKNKITETFS